ncbi:MAG: glycosyltransferase [Candidatus Baltobacteraceae bacterium]
MKFSGKISVVMPAYNEAAFITSNVHETVATLTGLNYDFEVIVVDDGSTDQTHLAAAQVLSAHAHRVRVVRYDRNEGKGNALICGSGYASGDLIAFLDADMDLHPSQLARFFEILEASGADAVIGSKWHKESRVSYPVLRKVYSLTYFTFVRLLFGLPVRDTQTGLKLFRANALKSTLPYLLAKRFAFDVELLANMHRRGYKIVSAPVTLSFKRTLGRIRIKHVWRTFLDTLAIFYRMHLIHYYDRPLVPSKQQRSRLIQFATAEEGGIAHLQGPNSSSDPLLGEPKFVSQDRG